MRRNWLAILTGSAIVITTLMGCESFGPIIGPLDFDGFDLEGSPNPPTSPYPFPFPPTFVVAELHGNGYGRIRFHTSNGDVECELRAGVLTRNGQPLRACVGTDTTMVLVAESAWFSSFGGWSGPCTVVSPNSCQAHGPRVGATFSQTGPLPITIVSGDGQSALPSQALPETLVVRLTGPGGGPAAGEPVQFEGAQGSSFSPGSGVTDANGEFRTSWTLGPAPGTYQGRVTATSEAMWGVTAAFNATALAMGNIVIWITTSGNNPDPDGYTILLHPTGRTTIASNASGGFPQVSPGTHELELTGMAPNCTVSNNPRTVTVMPGATTQTTYMVVCS